MAKDLEDSKPFIEGRGKDFCRGCLQTRLFSALDLGNMPIANELLQVKGNSVQTYPLHLSICCECGLGQVADVVTPERIFRDYRYLSSASTTFLKHATDFVTERIKLTNFGKKDWVLEIASNDGYLLRNFEPYGIKTIGIEPAENVAEISRNLGIDTIPEFFSSRLARDLLAKYGSPKLIIANNVLAHVPDVSDFIRGLEILCDSETEISIENPSLASILEKMQFDTIYHEHFSYLSATSVSNLARTAGLALYKVESLNIHGGSNRYWLRKSANGILIHDSVAKIIAKEAEMFLFDETKWVDYSSKVSGILAEFRTWLQDNKEIGRRVYGYGAAAKASTILNAIDFEPGLISAIADVSLEKQKRYMPQIGIKIISPDELFHAEPSDVVIFPWNIETEIAKFVSDNLKVGVRLWSVIPTLHEIFVT